MFTFVKTPGTRAMAAVAVLALVVQPCVACLTGGGGEAIAAPKHASHGRCALPADYAMAGDHSAPGTTDCPTLAASGSAAADACPTLSARGTETYVPATAAIPVLPAPATPLALAPSTSTIESELAASHGAPADPVPLFLRHAAFRI